MVGTMNPSDRLTQLLGLTTPPVGVAFADSAPTGIRRVGASQPASCSYWTLAASGEVFYTEAADHKSCAVGAHTHGVPLSADDQTNLHGLVSTMVGLGYLDPAEVPQIPHRNGFGVAVYAPLGRMPVVADVVMVRGQARQLMLLAEAAQLAGIAGTAPTLGRPTCAVLPQTIETHATSASFGCIGNRIYTGLSDGEAWFAVPGDRVEALLEKLTVVAKANRELEAFHRQRAEALQVRP
jgi:uncharacterized protein (DUF169 family)